MGEALFWGMVLTTVGILVKQQIDIINNELRVKRVKRFMRRH